MTIQLLEKRYKEIYAVIMDCYRSIYILKSINKSGLENDNSMVSKQVEHVLAHLCRLAKENIALNIYKVFYDKKYHQTNVISRLKNDLNKYIRENKMDTDYLKYSSVENLDRMRKSITDLRKKYLSHFEIDGDHISIQMNDLYVCVDELKNYLNYIGNTARWIDVPIIKNASLGLMEINLHFGVMEIIKAGKEE